MELARGRPVIKEPTRLVYVLILLSLHVIEAETLSLAFVWAVNGDITALPGCSTKKHRPQKNMKLKLFTLFAGLWLASG